MKLYLVSTCCVTGITTHTLKQTIPVFFVLRSHNFFVLVKITEMKNMKVGGQKTVEERAGVAQCGRGAAAREAAGLPASAIDHQYQDEVVCLFRLF